MVWQNNTFTLNSNGLPSLHVRVTLVKQLLEAKMRLKTLIHPFYLSQYIVDCGLHIVFEASTYKDIDWLRVGLQIRDVKMRLTNFWEVFVRLRCPFRSISSITTNDLTKKASIRKT